MTYPEKEIFTELIAEIKAKSYYFISKSHEAPVHFDMDRAQYETPNEANEFPFNRAAIFVRFGEMEYEAAGGFKMRGTIPIIITCVQDKYIDAMDGATSQPEYMKMLEWKYLVHDILNDFKGDCFSRLQLVKINTDHDNRNLHVETLEYACFVTLANNPIPPP